MSLNLKKDMAKFCSQSCVEKNTNKPKEYSTNSTIGDAKYLRETARWIFDVLIGSEVYSIVTYLLSENSDDGNSDCCASAVVTKIAYVKILLQQC